MQKAFDPKSGPLTDMSARPPSRQNRRCELFTSAFGELRNPKAHGDSRLLGLRRADGALRFEK